MLRRVLITAFLAILLVATTAAAGFSDGSSSPSNSLTASSRFCTLDPTVTLSASADTFVNSASTGTNYGSNAAVEVGPFGVVLSLNQRQGLVRFDLPTVPSRCTLTDATLRLFNSNAANGRTINVHRADRAWQENTVTWGSGRPLATGSAVSATAAAGWQTWSVLGHVQAQYAGSNFGFLLSDPNLVLLSQIQNYRSREASQTAERPQLVLTFGS